MDADARAAAAVKQHHQVLLEAMTTHERAIRQAATEHEAAAPRERAIKGLLTFARQEVLPHAMAEEQTIYRVAQEDSRARMLVQAMLDEHRRLQGLIDDIDAATDPVDAAASALALREMFRSHLYKEDAFLIGFLLQLPDVSLAELLHGMHQLVGPAGNGYLD